MANNQYVNKVVFGDETLIDLSNDTVDANKMLSGTTAHDKSGALINGSIPYRTSNDITNEVIANPEVQRFYWRLTAEAGYYQYRYTKGTSAIYLPIPETGSGTFTVYVPNGTLNPDKTVEEDWIPIDITVDSNGNSNVTDDTIPATGVSF